MNRRLIVIGPVPPPHHGVTVSTKLVLDNPLLGERFAVEHLDTSDRRPIDNIGRWDPRNILLALKSLVQLLARTRGRPGVVYLPLSQGTAALLRDCLLIWVASLRGWAVAAHLRGGEFRRVYEEQPRPMRRLIRSSLARLHSVAVLGAKLRPLFEGLVAPDRIVVVPNGTPDVERDGTRREAETGLFLSNLRRRKGVVEALEAALLVIEEDPSARFDFVGAWEEPELERTVLRRAETAGGRIRFLPPVVGEEHRRTLAAAGFMVFPPVEPEGHPRVVLEALAAGLPVVTTDRGAIAETVVDGESGFVLDDPVPGEIAERVLRLLRDRELSERMSRAARERYLECFTQECADERLADWLAGAAAELDRSGR